MHTLKLEAAVELVRSAKGIIEDEKKQAQHLVKGEFDFATRVDLEVESYIRRELKRRFPDDQFLGEEEEDSPDFSGNVWILDPIDGTTNLIHHFAQYSVSLALAQGGEIALGAIYNPVLDHLFTAARGQGAFFNGRPIRVSGVKKLHESLVRIGTAPYTREHAVEDFRVLEEIFVHCQDIRRSGSAALEIAYVACGWSEAYYERVLKPWDYAAAKLLLEEAGGTVTTFRGEPLPVGKPCSVLATNGLVHEEMLGYLRRLPA